MPFSVGEIAAAMGAQAAGDLEFVVERAREPSAAGPQDLALAMDPAYGARLAEGRAQAAFLWPGADWQALGLKAAIFAPRGRLAMAGLTQLMRRPPQIGPGLHETVIIGPGAEIGEGAAIGPYVTIGAGVRIGARARIASHVSIAEGAVIGDDALILNGACIGPGVSIGARFVCQPGAAIGADGFSFVTPEPSGVEEIRSTLSQRTGFRAQAWVPIHALASVSIGDDVEFGANSTIDRGTIRDTTVGSGTKIDNLVQIGHNCQIGRDCLFCGLVGIAGSARIGDRVVLGGQVGVGDHVQIGDDVIAGGASKIMNNAPAGRVLLGYPAVKMEMHFEMQKALRRLPKLAARVAELEKVISLSHRND